MRSAVIKPAPLPVCLRTMKYQRDANHKLIKYSLPALLLLVAVQSPVPAGESVQLPGDLYLEAAEQGIPVFRVDARASRADILVFRGGKLARFGHDHVVSTTEINGFVSLPANFENGRADLTVPLATLEVDRGELREKYGLKTKVSVSAKMGTRRNMLEKVLEVTDWNNVSIRATVARPDLHAPVLDINITLHGINRNFELPVSMQVTGDELHVKGTFTLQQTDYGMHPYSALLGGLRVQDGVEIYFDIVARRYYFDVKNM